MAPQKNELKASCSTFEEDLVLLHYGDLDGAERDKLERHLASCVGCAGYLAELIKLMPLTVKSDNPPEIFWSDYNRELRRKLNDAAERNSWWTSFAVFFQPRWLPAFATAAVVVLALTFTVGKGIWPTQSPIQEETALLEALPMAENLDFFNAMDFLDDLELLEFMGTPWNSNV